MLVRARRPAVVRTMTLPPPVGGWNARDPIANMDEADAIICENWYPRTGDVQLRKGHSQHATGLPAQVETLMVYSAGATKKLFAASDAKIYDVTAAGAVGAAAVSSTTNARWQYINMTTSGGTWLMAVNGAVKMRYFDGTTWSADGGTYTVTVLDTATAASIEIHKSRIWFAVTDSMTLYYLPVNSIQGAATAFPLQGVANKGGHVMAIGTWTLDAGRGSDDHFVVVTSEGQVIVYAGTDPSSASTWALVGVWDIARPLGRSCLYKYGGDLLVACQDGILPLSQALESAQGVSTTDPTKALSFKIKNAIAEAAAAYGSNFGWQMIYGEQQNMLLLNVPVAVGSQQQYAMNTASKARPWTKFKGWPANCWESFNGWLYFGGNTVVCKAWDTLADNGTQIVADCQQAFNYFGSRGRTKRLTMCRPIFQGSAAPSFEMTVNVDYDTTVPSSALSVYTTTVGVFGSGKFGQCVFGGENIVWKSWQGINGSGYCASPRLRAGTLGAATNWIATDFIFELGAYL